MMPNIKIIDDLVEINQLGCKWISALKFNSKNRVVNERGNTVSSNYQGHHYTIIDKKDYKFSNLEYYKRSCLGTLVIVCTFGIALLSESVRNLFKSKKSIRFAILKTSQSPNSFSFQDENFSNNNQLQKENTDLNTHHLSTKKLNDLNNQEESKQVESEIKIENEVEILDLSDSNLSYDEIENQSTEQDLLDVIPSNTQVKIEDTFTKEQLTCPITLELFIDAVILLEDGFSYERKAIEQWLIDHPNQSPMIGTIPSATLGPNRVLEKEPICIITKQPFVEPYYCVEDGQTYEKEAIIKWFENSQENILKYFFKIVLKTPYENLGESYTLYPNKVLFTQKIPENQHPLILKIDMNQMISDHFEDKNHTVRCIFDIKIRNLIQDYINEKDYIIRKKLFEQINQRRIELGLKVQKDIDNSIDLSHLDLSNMNLRKLFVKECIIKETNFSNSTLEKCYLGSCQFLYCNMQNTVFKDCNFDGGEVSFFKTDMKNATIDSKCCIEEGRTWNSINYDSIKKMNPLEDNFEIYKNIFKKELSERGAKNVDSVNFMI